MLLMRCCEAGPRAGWWQAAVALLSAVILFAGSGAAIARDTSSEQAAELQALVSNAYACGDRENQFEQGRGANAICGSRRDKARIYRWACTRAGVTHTKLDTGSCSTVETAWTRQDAADRMRSS